MLFARDQVTNVLSNMAHQHVIIVRQEEMERQAQENLAAHQEERERRVSLSSLLQSCGSQMKLSGTCRLRFQLRPRSRSEQGDESRTFARNRSFQQVRVFKPPCGFVRSSFPEHAQVAAFMLPHFEQPGRAWMATTCL